MYQDLSVSKKIETFFTQFRHQEYKRGEILIRSDDPPPGVFYLTDGSVKQYAISQNGDEIVVNIFKPISFFPMSWALNETPNVYYFEAMTDIKVWRAPKKESVLFVKDNPDVLYDLLKRVYSGLDGTLLRLTYMMSGDAYERLITELLIYAKRFGKGQLTMEVTISEKDLAIQAGLTRETVSREMKILKEKGLIGFDNHQLIIKDILALESELSNHN